LTEQQASLIVTEFAHWVRRLGAQRIHLYPNTHTHNTTHTAIIFPDCKRKLSEVSAIRHRATTMCGTSTPYSRHSYLGNRVSNEFPQL